MALVLAVSLGHHGWKNKKHVTDTTKYCIFPDEAIAVIHIMCVQHLEDFSGLWTSELREIWQIFQPKHYKSAWRLRVLYTQIKTHAWPWGKCVWAFLGWKSTVFNAHKLPIYLSHFCSFENIFAIVFRQNKFIMRSTALKLCDVLDDVMN